MVQIKSGKVIRIMDSQIANGEFEYLVKWDGGEYEATWEPSSEIKSRPGMVDAIKAFHAANPDSRKPNHRLLPTLYNEQT
jgi:hypothetical protein